ncbi:hypothetical protein Aph01nite_44480 [Acrocarpospora phusangensis]|uniref:Uncharacterized protein n=1 Tax=Acrocarpospora phusangensis TaxID=1070424 RepID=A0A919QCG6_9ACTN|nr:hypothetical protein [Acrocarpospora phusangensis]GIH26138.1 hypothetical protein Aph01nite_44480 [Acrocarpospora phusangensis]
MLTTDEAGRAESLESNISRLLTALPPGGAEAVRSDLETLVHTLTELAFRIEVDKPGAADACRSTRDSLERLMSLEGPLPST